MRPGFRIEGKLAWALAEKMGEQVRKQSIQQTSEVILGESAQEVPLEEGTLLRSGGTSINAAGDEGYIHYDTQYAVPQHERMDFTHDQGRKAKYLEDPLFRNRDTFRKVVAKNMKGAF